MKCYFCKHTISRATRTYVAARNNREKSAYRDLCAECHTTHMHSLGYVSTVSDNGITTWRRKEA